MKHQYSITAIPTTDAINIEDMGGRRMLLNEAKLYIGKELRKE